MPPVAKVGGESVSVDSTAASHGDRSAVQRRVASNTAILVLLRVLMPAMAVVLVLALSRILGADGLGRYSLAFSILYLFNAIAPLGLNSVLTREVARTPQDLENILGNVLSVAGLASLVLTPVMLACGTLLGYDSETQRALWILGLAVVPCTAGVLFDAVFVAKERMDCIAWSSGVEYVFKVGFGVGVLLLGFGLETVLAMALIGRTLGCLVALRMFRRIGVQVRLAWHSPMLRKLMRLAPTFLMIGLFATLYWRIDVLMLSKLASVTEVGQYSAAWRLLELAMVIPQSLCLALYPHLAAAHAEGARVRQIGKLAVRYLTAFALPAALCIAVVSGPILAWLYGEEFRSAASVLSILMLTLVPYGWARFQAYALVSANHQRVDLWLNIVMSLLNAGLNLVLIPSFGALGAACSTFVAICAYVLVQSFYMHRKLPAHRAPWSLDIVVVVSSIITAAAVWMLRSSPMLGVAAVGAILYVSLLAAGRFFSRRELEMFGIQRVLDKIEGALPWRRAAKGKR